ncbi:hypothetical protein (nucleomorph) [Guillardia theta]|uniref:Uncharacterized protein n=1 Tax=Guillardia theta TaxID=55529 RepID=Q9AQX6_GUITH|nr:hypothetical protein GTHECHR2130 [Guillardia theta]XP_001713330.1 hypothetical protein GTHECHR2188 [Guillardia theta]XP_001713490.1 hypothetical protein GTHECHR3156 [Guillardia theta]XP_001713492.1 hypothetical protein GTHECHR3158 [Guillardia theta]XP_001713648.1 hypothetical protein GTHECHR1150 [Guillardia theta]XP_001713650.1 hypothetical protein GTHECHR1152 [Guillardia theta]AAK39792.1 hypothetical protein [Guillardia theta]AAK39794.1 hypothetical protein [Guillardia theta]AAK39943.1 
MIPAAAKKIPPLEKRPPHQPLPARTNPGKKKERWRSFRTPQGRNRTGANTRITRPSQKIKARSRTPGSL